MRLRSSTWCWAIAIVVVIGTCTRHVRARFAVRLGFSERTLSRRLPVPVFAPAQLVFAPAQLVHIGN